VTIEPTHVAVGAALAASQDLAALLNGDGQEAPAINGDRRSADVAVGAVFALRDGVVAATGLARRTGRMLLAPAAAVAATPVFAPGRRAAQRLLDDLERRGRQEAAASLAQSAQLIDALVRRVDGSPLVTGMVEDIVSRVLGPVLDEAIPQVLTRLAAEPEAVRVIIHSQSLGMAEQFVQRTRSGAAHGDVVVDRVTRRVFRRSQVTATPEPPPSPTLAPS
jgi:hypothetical protein